jgi:hypothetical protein
VLKIYIQMQHVSKHHRATKLWWKEHVVQVEDMRVAYTQDADLSSRAASCETNKGEIPDPVHTVLDVSFQMHITKS